MRSQRFVRSALALAVVPVIIVLFATRHHIDLIDANQHAAVYKTNHMQGGELPPDWDRRARELYNASASEVRRILDLGVCPVLMPLQSAAENASCPFRCSKTQLVA